LGIDVRIPRFSWQIVSDQNNVSQSAFQVQVSTSSVYFVENLIWDTGKVESDQSIDVEYQGPPLCSRKKYFYRVKIWDNHAQEMEWCEIQHWEMGLLDSGDWQAHWVTAPFKEYKKRSKPVYYFRKVFVLSKPIESARIYASALGLYELHLNGSKVGTDLFTPGLTDYRYHVQYQTYDATSLLSSAKNVIGIVLGEGWYRGRFQINKRNNWGKTGAVVVQVHIQFLDGTEMVLVTDSSWQVSKGPIIFSDIYDGEKYDAREEREWRRPDFDASEWAHAVHYSKYPLSRLVATCGERVARIKTHAPVKVFTTPKGETVVDMGQNMVGWVKMSVHGESGQEIVMDHGEILDNEGNFYHENLRTAKTQVTYICKGGEECFEPHFTFFGFRYVRVVNYAPVTQEILLGIVIHSDMCPTGSFDCSNSLLNQLQSNIRWGQEGNFLDIPTDCPQRDERLGWTGDAQVFARTAAFNFETGRFFTKWLRDIKVSHAFNGAIPFWVPSTWRLPLNSAGWGDVATILPWVLYLVYGDKRVLSTQYASMKRWFNYESKSAKRWAFRHWTKSKEFKHDAQFIWDTGFHFGDWLAPGENTKQWRSKAPWIATAFYAYSAQIMAKVAAVLGKTAESTQFLELAEKIRTAFTNRFVEPDGKITREFQTAYVLALEYDLLPAALRAGAAKYLVQDIAAHEGHLTTGFLGTPHLCFALSNNGHLDVAYQLLLQTTCPSWLYPVTKGATTIWERWDAIQPDGSINLSRMGSGNMVSFNHYAFGAIGDWLYRVVGGLDTREFAPGYKKSVIYPRPGGNLQYARVEFNSRYGVISSRWERDDANIRLTVVIPPNTSSEVHLVGAKLENVIANGKPLLQGGNFQSVSENSDEVCVNLGSGTYDFEWKLSKRYPQATSE